MSKYFIHDDHHNFPAIYKYDSGSSHEWRVWRLMPGIAENSVGTHWKQINLADQKERDEFLQWAIMCGSGGYWTGYRGHRED